MGDWQLTIDSNDPPMLARFWAPILGYELQPPPEGFESWNAWYLSIGVPEDEIDMSRDWVDRIHDPKGGGPKIWFQLVPEHKAGKNRLHLDVYVGGGRSVPVEERAGRIEARVLELLDAGATVHRRFPADFDGVEDPSSYFVVMQDPEGNEFCVA